MREGVAGRGLPEPESREDGSSVVITVWSIALRENGYARSCGSAGEGLLEATSGRRPIVYLHPAPVRDPCLT